MGRFKHALVVLCLLGQSATIARGEDRPNVVMIISDDQTYSDFGFMGNRVVQTPHLDALAARSARFTHGYVPSSVCRPSLVTLLTGLYPHQHGVHFNHPPPGFSTLTKTYDRDRYEAAREAAAVLIRRVDTLPRMLASQGYRCLQTGKYWEGHWKNAGFTDGMTTGKPVAGARHGNKQLADGQWVAHGNGDAGLAIGRETMQPIKDFLDDESGDPFFIWYAPFLPHLPHDSPKRFFDLYDTSVPEHQRAYYAACSQLDETVGELIEMTEKHSAGRNTLFVFVVDNGFRPDPNQPMPDGFGYNYTRRSKRSPFDDGLRTPILFHLSGQTRSATHPLLCSSVDIVPTVLQACGMDVPRPIRGRSLWPLATGQTDSMSPEPVFGEIYPGDASVLGNPSADIAYRWIRDGDYKLIVPHRQKGKVWGDYGDSRQLYNLVDDPNEQRDLADEPEHQPMVGTLQTKLDAWWRPGKHTAVGNQTGNR
ncbi:Arylsulfatase precursor [Stieleria maiorica]|uniref:Arylsulfatase n=1 Tax=Stieleria maiorica TaxID=2795974 RepID=A0A5B9M7H6_9BACT|nr:sulfatase-like hydrolase/transferase [Stieleria maiorica]QEF95990.1 Arylsulfatase precursor [Stieleria maiorica]